MKGTHTNYHLSLLFSALIITSAVRTFFFTSSCTTGSVALGYLDPGTGTMIISAVVGIVATLALGLKTFWYKIGRIFKPSTKKEQDTTEQNK